MLLPLALNPHRYLHNQAYFRATCRRMQYAELRSVAAQGTP